MEGKHLKIALIVGPDEEQIVTFPGSAEYSFYSEHG